LRKLLTIAAAALSGGLLFIFSGAGTSDMPKLQVELIVDEPLRTSGGTIFVSINHMSEQDFETRYTKQAPDTREGSLLTRARLSAMTNFVEIDTPQGDYVYRFIADPDGTHAGKTIKEEPIGVAGAGSLYIDLATNEAVFSRGGRDHHIIGSAITPGESRGLQSNSLDLRVDPATCVVSGPVRVCPARQNEVDWLLDIFRSEAVQ
jgi:hypothetical protein